MNKHPRYGTYGTSSKMKRNNFKKTPLLKSRKGVGVWLCCAINLKHPFSSTVCGFRGAESSGE
jgi:hypothetical protein